MKIDVSENRLAIKKAKSDALEYRRIIDKIEQELDDIDSEITQIDEIKNGVINGEYELDDVEKITKLFHDYDLESELLKKLKAKKQKQFLQEERLSKHAELNVFYAKMDLINTALDQYIDHFKGMKDFQTLFALWRISNRETQRFYLALSPELGTDFIESVENKLLGENE